LVIGAFALGAAIFFLMFQRALDLSTLLLILLLLACPAMHLFMHGGHGKQQE
jgi:hypothetical protein